MHRLSLGFDDRLGRYPDDKVSGLTGKLGNLGVLPLRAFRRFEI